MIALVRETAQRLARMSDPEPMRAAAAVRPRRASSSLRARSATAARSASNIAIPATNWIELALPWREELVGVPESGILASGAIVSLIDTCGGASVWMTLGHFQPIVTIDLRLDYLRPAVKGETVIARCECYKLTRQVAFVRGIAHGGDPERPIAQATGDLHAQPLELGYARSVSFFGLAQHVIGRLDLLEALARLPCRPA